MIEKFLNKAAKKLIAGDYTGPKSVVVLPNRRSEVFLKQEIKKINKNNIWLPDFLPIDEFVQKVSGISKADNISIGFDLFHSYQQKERENAKSIDEFLSWTPMILNDFNDIDNSMVDAKEVYSQLSAIKAIEQWSPERKILTELQENYLRFYNSMYDYYNGLKEILTLKNCGYQGMINRHLAENIEQSNIKWDRFLIIGINALSEAEIRIFSYLNQNYHTKFIWDIDQYYFNPSKGKDNHEAGKHILHIIDRLKLEMDDEVEQYLTKTKKKINIFGVPKSIGQVKFIGQELSKSNLDNNSNTAIVLANEGLLIPLLNSLPVNEGKNSYNLTLGYPTAASQIDHFFEAWIDVIESINSNQKTIKSNSLINLIENPVVKQILDTRKQITRSISELLIVSYPISIGFNEITNFIKQKDNDASISFSDLINEANNSSISQALLSLMNVIIKNIESAKASSILYGELLHSLTNILGKLIKYTSDYENDINFHSLKKISKQLFSLTNVNLVGEPLRGIQIMGMLETRTLDFDNIYILSVNEGILPKTTSVDSFIPMDIRRELNLPLPSDKTDIYSYHFHRLLQRSTNITLLYNSDAEKLGGGEKSRFILQIENELRNANPDIKISEKIIDTKIKKDGENIDADIIVIEKNKDIQDRISKLSQTGYSASLFNSYITCSLKFYFQQILRLKTESSIGQSIEANTFGTVIHETLESLYQSEIKAQISTDRIKSRIDKSEKLLISIFKKNYKNDNLTTGKNLLIFEVAKNYISNFLKWEIKNQKLVPSQLISTEEKIVSNIPGSSITVKGTIDRVDELLADGKTRIIDYKTGFINPSNLKVADITKLTTDPDLSKSFQVMYYAWLYNLKYSNSNIEAGIISMRSMSHGFIPLILKEFQDISEYFQIFGESVHTLVDEISNTNIPFRQTDKIERCKFCDYSTICNRVT